MPVDNLITSPYLQLIKAELAPLASQLNEQYTLDYVADEMFAALGEDLLAKATDKERRQLQKDWLARFEFFKTEVPIPDDLAERCFGSEARSPLTARGEAVKTYGEAAVLALAKRRGFSSLTALKPEPGPGKAKAKAAEKPAGNLSDNPWSKSFRGDEVQRAARIAAIIRTGTRFAEGMAKAAGTSVGKPLRQ